VEDTILVFEEISPTEVKKRLDEDANLQLIDVRQPNEHEFARIKGSKLIPLGEVLSRTKELDSSRDLILYCKMGGRSAQAADALIRSGYQGKVYNMKGGITAWSNEVDPSVPKY
jgi:rhodanese-related sulfurtransferase